MVHFTWTANSYTTSSSYKEPPYSMQRVESMCVDEIKIKFGNSFKFKLYNLHCNHFLYFGVFYCMCMGFGNFLILVCYWNLLVKLQAREDGRPPAGAQPRDVQ